MSNSPRAIEAALRLYDDQPLGIRAFVRARHLLCPFSAIEPHVPRSGRVLDLGCGHGLFSAIMGVTSPERSILGVDPSSAKIQVARQLEDRLPNARFFQGTIGDVAEGDFDAVTIMDVLYLLPVPEKLKIMARCRELLRPGGRLVLKTNDTHPAWKFRWAWLQEVAMTRIGLTMGEHALYFISCKQHVELLKEAGFSRIDVVHIPFFLPYPHTLFNCTP